MKDKFQISDFWSLISANGSLQLSCPYCLYKDMVDETYVLEKGLTTTFLQQFVEPRILCANASVSQTKKVQPITVCGKSVSWGVRTNNNFYKILNLLGGCAYSKLTSVKVDTDVIHKCVANHDLLILKIYYLIYCILKRHFIDARVLIEDQILKASTSNPLIWPFPSLIHALCIQVGVPFFESETQVKTFKDISKSDTD
ncbi:hypothetical protein ACJIZ3_003451 [Penstemon smallii]|uniref:Uncharacterized protein n=1 Tax=Penstemon smallii TaxID=265156 RepID=A0ABD3UD29_9LAMI